ncbi:restriction endonuclease [Rathayibacter sp. AY1B1]|uniref:HNH endonuclease n=1 Tax=unclassified Rathayibacter TaxID=2609250 RepID=UPI000CE7C055|nr:MULTISPECIES: HNH endonuclease [unclassified Rathayibacter]PPI20182.1 restriction endonuclease [Rathayibacter sp. AY1B6]PPI31114.1 restriction endonuclease [Rathayibacter sp. AY1B1]
MTPQAVSGRRTSRDLHDLIESALGLSGLSVVALSDRGIKPFRYAISESALALPTIVSVYAWNITHGGGSARADDEFRIQITGAVPVVTPGELTLILGWSDLHQVFASWDAEVHNRRKASSPSLQVREDVLIAAHERGHALATRSSGDQVQSFRRELLASFCLSKGADLDIRRLKPSDYDETDLVTVNTREILNRKLSIAYRAWDFSNRVRAAYGNRCAMCGLGLNLIEGAHIVPVASPYSNDETRNGLALCANHHLAYDRALVSVDANYDILLSRAAESALEQDGSPLDGRWLAGVAGGSLMVLPNEPSELPDPRLLILGQKIRSFDGAS